MPDIYITLNARLRPLDRGDRFEDPLTEMLEDKLRGVEVTGGGTMMQPGGEPSNCDIDLSVKGNVDEVLPVIIAALERLGAPKGSTVRVGGKDKTLVKFGITEGLGVYLDGTDLPDEVYQGNDINELIARLHESLAGVGEMFSYWEGPTTTALYFYGTSADQMRDLISGVLRTHPLAQGCRTEQLTP